jgi:hypothetical protein
MSERLNLYGFSLARMRRLFRSQDTEAVGLMRDRLAAESPSMPLEQLRGIVEVIEQAVGSGVPLAGLVEETHEHWLAAHALAGHDQQWLVTDASVYGASILRDGLWRRYGKHARPEIRALLRGLAEGVPLFGQRFPGVDEAGCLVYAAVALEKLRAFEPGLDDLREQVLHRAGRRRAPAEGDEEICEFVVEFCGWIDQIREAGLDLWYCTA